MGETRSEEVAALGGGSFGGLARGAGPCVALSLCLLAAGAFAFDSEKWMQKRDDLTHEVERLRAAYAKCVAQLQTPAEDVTVPIETFPDGSVKFVVRAKKAQYFLDSDLVWAEGVVARKFKKDGSLDMTLEAANCVVDRLTKSGWAEGAATLTQGESVFRGKGIYFSSPEGYVRVTQDSDLDSKDLKSGGAFGK
jgi:hypothetical protein